MEKEEKTIEYSNQYFKNIEEARQTFRSYYISTNIVKAIGIFLAIGVLVAGFVLARTVLSSQSLSTLLLAGGLGIAILALFTFFINKARKKKITVFMDTYYISLNEYLFKDDFEIKVNLEDRIAIEDFDKNGLYKDVGACPSRNVSYISNKELNLKTYEISGQVQVGRKTYPVFVGKIFEFENKYEGDPIILYIKAKKHELELPPTNLDNINEVENTDNYVIYSNNKDYKKVFKKSILDAINKLEPDDVFIDGSISIQKGTTYFALGLDDSIMAIPFKEPFEEIPMKTLKVDIEKTLKIVKLLNENGKKVG